MTQAQRYPLTWPQGWARTPSAHRRRASFGKSESWQGSVQPDGSRPSRVRKAPLAPADATRRLELELDRLGATNALLSTNLELRIDGTPRSDRRDPVDVGAAVYFALKGKPLCLACDKWDRVADNIAALAQHIDALRRIERYGVGRLEQAFAGYAALPPSAEDWWLVLRLPSTATRDQVLARHRQLAAEHHPDRGGRSEDMARINAARDVAIRILSEHQATAS